MKRAIDESLAGAAPPGDHERPHKAIKAGLIEDQFSVRIYMRSQLIKSHILGGIFDVVSEESHLATDAGI